jgi:putative component of toxin-antitoxin plasmid stabilization module
MHKERMDWIKSVDIYDYNTKISETMDRIFEINFGKKVIELQSGDFFGEKALETSAPRNATIITTSNCDFIMLKKKDYISKVREAFKRKKKQLFNFYERILKIKTTNFGENKSVYSIMRSFEEKNCSFGEVILDHLKDSSKILLLREGTGLTARQVFDV